MDSHAYDQRELDRRETADRNVGFLLHDTARLMRINYDRRMRELGLTRSQWWVLTHLYFHEGISQTELSEILEIERATLGRLLDRLESKDWLERRIDPTDRRVKRVFLTGAVGELLQTMRALAGELRTEALAGLPPDRQEEFIDTLSGIKNNLSRMLLNGSSQNKDGSNG
ncbi:MAG: MarR family transcriptional regulator [Alphaproteobacteria bacterium]|jgi:DNA-binding MarR family transcriptional regulator|nr:MarR family transcriptional regulator [Alphaproteobacteria bacterium]MDP6567601.1 MarR family transcriptional regulator [Alphaproteobacteria bacterium]MDP6815637.1 MarR family transcriptional regulator [Alphaproteobacteria bacterium]